MQMQSYRLVWEGKLIHVRGKEKKKLNALLRPRCNHFNISDQFQSMIPPYSCQSIKVESAEAYLENIIIIKVKDHYNDWKLYRHFWQFANCEMKEEENFKHLCRCVTVVRKLAVNLTQSIILWIPGPALQIQKSHQRISRSSQKQEKVLLLDLKCNKYSCTRKVKTLYFAKQKIKPIMGLLGSFFALWHFHGTSMDVRNYCESDTHTVTYLLYISIFVYICLFISEIFPEGFPFWITAALICHLTLLDIRAPSWTTTIASE